MPQLQLSVITHSIIVSRILYALPAWGGFLTVKVKNRINAFFQAPQTIWLHKLCYDHMIDHSDYELSTKVCSGSHSLHHLLPSYRTSDLRLRDHPFQLPDYYTDLHKKSVVRSLYAYIKQIGISCIAFMCFYCFCVFFFSLLLYVFVDVRLSHLNKDYLLTYL